MDVVTLLREARASGLSVAVNGDQLVVTGPKSAAEVVRKLAENKVVILAALNGSADLSALSAVGKFDENAEKTTKPADADKLDDRPGACHRCGSAQGWLTAEGRIACAECEPRPPETDTAVLVDTNAGPAWRRYDSERAEVRVIDAPDPWHEALPWDDSTPSCRKCKSVEGWTDALDSWHCWKCSPPHRTEKLLNDRERILQRAWQRLGRKHGR